MLLTFRTFPAVLLLSAAPAWAADPDSVSAVAGALAQEKEDIIVIGERPEYGVKSTSTATRTNTALEDIPQAISVISERQIEDQALRSFNDLLLFIPGASPNPGEGHRDQIVLRGNNATADFFIDGVRDDVQYFRDFYNVDRVEVLKGPNAMIFGRGGGGGVVNRVLKRSSLSEYRQLVGSADSSGGMRFTGDIDQPLSSAVGLRINGMYEEGDSFRRHYDLERFAVNPTIGVLAGRDTRVDLSYEYLRDRRTTDRGVPAFNDEPLEGFDREFFGDPNDSFAKADVQIGTARVEHDFGGGVTLRNRTLLGDYDKFYQNVYPTQLRENTGEVVLGAYNSRSDRTNLFNQTDLVWQNRFGGLHQTLLFGFEVGRQKSRNARLTGIIAGGNATLSAPTVDRDVTFLRNAGDADNRTTATVAAVYAQDQIRLSPQLEIVAGLRFDSFNLKVNDERTSVPTFSRRDSFWSPRLGLVFKPQKNLSVYTSYSRSYLPQSGDQFSALSFTTEALKPERFDSYEVGAKWEPVPGLLATAALYQLDRKNTQARDANDRVVLTGAQRSRGLELGLERSVSDRWQISAGYAWQRAKITERTTAAAEGNEVPLVPRHSFSLWNRHDVSQTLGLGLGVVARTKSYASLTNQVSLPGFARVDAAAYYRISPRIEAQINAENLLGTDYFPTAYSDNNIAPGAPRTFRAALRLAM